MLTLASDVRDKLLVSEALRVMDMTRAKAKQDKQAPRLTRQRGCPF